MVGEACSLGNFEMLESTSCVKRKENEKEIDIILSMRIRVYIYKSMLNSVDVTLAIEVSRLNRLILAPPVMHAGLQIQNTLNLRL